MAAPKPAHLTSMRRALIRTLEESADLTAHLRRKVIDFREPGWVTDGAPEWMPAIGDLDCVTIVPAAIASAPWATHLEQGITLRLMVEIWTGRHTPERWERLHHLVLRALLKDAGGYLGEATTNRFFGSEVTCRVITGADKNVVTKVELPVTLIKNVNMKAEAFPVE